MSKWVLKKHVCFETPLPSVCAKLRYLRAELDALHDEDPAMHAVIFTHFPRAAEMVVQMLPKKFSVFKIGFTRDTAAEQHQTIRDFQSLEPAGIAKVLVLTVRAGAVGMTLTAASRVYLLEPALSPAAEVQMAGRIHRLGQTKDVLIKRLCYKNSLDMAIDNLHAQIVAGTFRLFDGKLPASAVRLLSPEPGSSAAPLVAE